MTTSIIHLAVGLVLLVAVNIVLGSLNALFDGSFDKVKLRNGIIKGITRNGVNSWEQGLSMPSPACLVDLAKVFGVSTDYLLGLERLTTVDVTGLADRDVAVLAELAERLKNCKD